MLLTLILKTLSLSAQLRDGTLMRSESIYTFDATKAKGDFYVSPRGNDNWSGTLAEPNAAGTDGPFASINRAQQGVRDLKAQVYQSKKHPTFPNIMAVTIRLVRWMRRLN